MSAEQTTDGAVGATEMEGRVALALYSAASPRPNALGFRLSRDIWVKAARAAIRTMRDPTIEMLHAEYVNVSAWESMIDAATAPVQESSTAAVPLK